MHARETQYIRKKEGTKLKDPGQPLSKHGQEGRLDPEMESGEPAPQAAHSLWLLWFSFFSLLSADWLLFF